MFTPVFERALQVLGEGKILEYTTAQFKNNQPIWKHNQTEAVMQIATGEYPIMCGAHYATIFSVLRSDPSAKLAMALPKEVPVSLGEIMANIKGSHYPNAALLLAGWLVPMGKERTTKSGGGLPLSKKV